jgi:hypothetical protein
MRLAFFGSGYALLRVLEGLFFPLLEGLFFLAPRDFTTWVWVIFLVIYTTRRKITTTKHLHRFDYHPNHQQIRQNKRTPGPFPPGRFLI